MVIGMIGTRGSNLENIQTDGFGMKKRSASITA
jgi:hypothetical protein